MFIFQSNGLPLPDMLAGIIDAERMVAVFIGLLEQQITLVAASLSGLRTEVHVSEGEFDDEGNIVVSQPAHEEAVAVPPESTGEGVSSPASDASPAAIDNGVVSSVDVLEDIIPFPWLDASDSVDADDYGSSLRHIFNDELLGAVPGNANLSLAGAEGSAQETIPPNSHSRANFYCFDIDGNCVGNWIAMAPACVIEGYLCFIRDHFECPVCFDWKAPEFFECRGGHDICGYCALRCRRCSMCRDPGGYRHVLSIERKMDHHFFPCRYTGGEGQRGCPQFIAGVLWRRHVEYECPLRLIDSANE